MKSEPSKPSNDNLRGSAIALLSIPISLFPLAALLTYDWRSQAVLCNPPMASANWIGALGDAFAYYGYAIFGLAIWMVPLLCIIAALGKFICRTSALRKGMAWSLMLLLATSCLIQVISQHTPEVSNLTEKVNIANAGGIVGYMVMTKFLSALVSDFGSAVIIVLVMMFSLIAAIGKHNLILAGRKIIAWAIGRPLAPARPAENADDAEIAAYNAEQAAYEAALNAKNAAKLQREQELAAIRAAKAAAEAARAAEAENEAKPIIIDRPAPVKPAPAKPRPTATQKSAPAVAETPADDKGPYVLPGLSLLNPLKKSTADHSDVDEMSRRLIDTLKLFGIDAEMSFTVKGPVVTKYAVKLAPGTRYSTVTNIQDNLMGALHAKSLRIEAPIPGKEEVGIEVPNRAPAGISFREIFESDAWRDFKGELPLLFGKDAAGNELIADLASMPHMLVAGATGQGKSVCLNAIINGLLMSKTPEQLKLIMVDPKSVEFTNYASIPHLIVPVITENRKAATSLMWAVVEMEKRLKLFARAKVKNIYDFNHRLQFTQTDMFGDDTEIGSSMPKTVPYIIIIIDEVADLMSQCAKEVVPHISRLTAKARAAGIHLILATQRPDAKVITGTIKANIPGRVAFKTATAIDSRTILDDGGAENLIGRGDMLFKSKEGQLIRAQGAWISDEEIFRVTQFIEQHASTQFDAKFKENLDKIKDQEIDPFANINAEENAAEQKQNAEAARAQIKADAAASDFKKAIECVINTKRASTSHFQRQMGWGYNHAAKIVDMLAARGVISAQVGVGPRQIIMNENELLALFNEGEAPAEAADDAATTAETDDLFTQEEATNDPIRSDPEIGA